MTDISVPYFEAMHMPQPAINDMATEDGETATPTVPQHCPLKQLGIASS